MSISLLERYVATLILSGSGDAIGYKNGNFEFCRSGTKIHEEVKNMGGLESLVIKRPDWMVSDDTVMHLATGEALVESHMSGKDHIREYQLTQLARKYISCFSDMNGRGPGLTCSASIHQLKPSIHEGYRIPFSSKHGGCGGSMRSACIGLRYPKEADLAELITVSVESGRMTHHHPVGYLGSFAAAFLTTCALNSKPIQSWGKSLLDTLPRAKEYVVATKQFVEDNLGAWHQFEDKLSNYLTVRGIADGESQPVFPSCYGIKERDAFYKSQSYSGTGGASGHDSIIIAYDALLGAGNDWLELCRRSMMHSGDSDSTGTIAAAWYGALYGLCNVPPSHYEHLEYLGRLKNVGEKLYKIVHKECTCKSCS